LSTWVNHDEYHGKVGKEGRVVWGRPLYVGENTGLRAPAMR